MAMGVLFSFSPLIGSNCKVEAGISNRYFINSKTNELDLDNRYSFFHENTIYPQSALEIKPKVNATIIEEETKKPIKRVEVLETMYTTLTGYSSTVDQTNSQPFITASGAWVRDGIVATNFLPAEGNVCSMFVFDKLCSYTLKNLPS